MKRIVLGLALGWLACTPVWGQQNIVETAAAAGNFKTLLAAAKAAGLADTLASGELTVFAPTDEAFAKIDQHTLADLLKPENKQKLISILTYHVVPGRVSAQAAYGLSAATTVNGQRLPIDFQAEQPSIGNAGIVKTDIPCSNGVIHVIDTVLMPASQSIPTVAKQAKNFKTLLAAVGEAGLADALSGSGPFTVFAPTDDAFAKLPEGTVATLLKPENKQKLTDILKYHVIPARIYATDAVAAQSADTLLGRSIQARFSEQGLMINDARVVARDIDASNGVIHVIDSVLIPGSKYSRHEAMTLLSDAVGQGAPVYNSGHHQQCCDIYMTALAKVEDGGIDGADDHTMTLIRSGLSEARGTHGSTDRAWVLRRTIDSLYSRMSRMETQLR